MKRSRLALTVIIILLVGGVISFIFFSNNTPSEVTNKELDQSQEAEETVTYVIQYNASWSSETHPETLPSGAHVSPIVIVGHKEEDALFASGSLASAGIEIMAETGGTEILIKEMAANSDVLRSIVGKRLDVPESLSLELTLDQGHSLISAVSMLAPSPDWFIAVRNIQLFEDGQWKESVELPFSPYDAGTDLGQTFTAADIDAVPAEAIQSPLDPEFAAAAAENDFATITITRR